MHGTKEFEFQLRPWKVRADVGFWMLSTKLNWICLISIIIFPAPIQKKQPKKLSPRGGSQLGKILIHFLTRPKEYGELFGSLATDVVHGGTIQPAQLCRFCSRKSLAGLRNFGHLKRCFSVLQNCTKQVVESYIEIANQTFWILAR